MGLHFKCDKAEILQALSIVDKAVGQKNINPVLEGIYIDVKNDIIEFKATNLTLSIETSIKGEILEQGTTVVPSRVFHDIISKYSDGVVDFKTDDEKIEISNQYSKTVLNTINHLDFPKLPVVEQNNVVSIEQNLFKDIINTTIFSASTNESSGILTGILFEIEDNVLNVVSLDAYRLAFRKIKLDNEVSDCSAVIPASSLKEIYKILKDSDEMIKMYLSENMCHIDAGHSKIYTRLLTGNFIKYKSIFPDSFSTKITLNTDDVLKSVERASILARSENEKVVKFSIDDKTLLITSASENGKANEIVDIYFQGKNIDINFNSRYLIDVFRVIDEQEIVMEYNTNVNPCIIKSERDDSFLYLVLPVHPD